MSAFSSEADMAVLKNLFAFLLTAYGEKYTKTHGVLTESWKADDGSSWYRKYADGWIEQGGWYKHGASTVASVSISLTTPFATTEYIISFTRGDPTFTEGYAQNVMASIFQFWGVTTTSFCTKGVGTSSAKTLAQLRWFACGY